MLLEIAREVGLRREAQSQGDVLQRAIGRGEKSCYLVDDALVDDSLGRAIGNATRDLSQIACTHVELLSIKGHIGITVVIALNGGQKLIVKLLAPAVALSIVGRKRLQL